MHKRYPSFYLILLLGSSFSASLPTVSCNWLSSEVSWPGSGSFVMEGLLTGIIAVIGFLLLINLPPDAHQSRKFLSRREIDFVL